MSKRERRVLSAWALILAAMALWVAFGDALPWLQGLLMGYGVCLIWTLPRPDQPERNQP